MGRKKDDTVWPLQRSEAEWREQLSDEQFYVCLLYTSPSPRDVEESRMPSSA